jgi:hypothetical protein
MHYCYIASHNNHCLAMELRIEVTKQHGNDENARITANDRRAIQYLIA